MLIAVSRRRPVLCPCRPYWLSPLPLLRKEAPPQPFSALTNAQSLLCINCILRLANTPPPPPPPHALAPDSSSGLPTSFAPLPRPHPDCLGPLRTGVFGLLLTCPPHAAASSLGPRGQCGALSAQTPARIRLLFDFHCGRCLLSSWMGWQG